MMFVILLVKKNKYSNLKYIIYINRIHMNCINIHKHYFFKHEGLLGYSICCRYLVFYIL